MNVIPLIKLFDDDDNDDDIDDDAFKLRIKTLECHHPNAVELSFLQTCLLCCVRQF